MAGREFLTQNLLDNGYERTAPIGSFPPNGYGLYKMAGNVWEWILDWYRDRHIAKTCCGGINPKGATMEQSCAPNLPEILIPRKVLEGDSYLYAPNYCLRYRPAARIANRPTPAPAM